MHVGEDAFGGSVTVAIGEQPQREERLEIVVAVLGEGPLVEVPVETTALVEEAGQQEKGAQDERGANRARDPPTLR